MTQEGPAGGISPEQVGAFFDVDETLVRGATVFWAAREMFSHGFFGIKELQYAAIQTLRYVLRGEDASRIAEYGDRAASLIEGNSVEHLQELAESIYDRYFVPHVYQATYERLKEHREAGHQVWLISATPWLIAEVFARRLGAAGGIGTRMQVSGGILQGKLDGKLVHGPGKASVVEEIAEENNLRLEASWAYSDSANDIPLLSAVGNPVAVNPDRALADHARVEGWEILRVRTRANELLRDLTKTGVLIAGTTAVVALIYKVARGRRNRSLKRVGKY